RIAVASPGTPRTGPNETNRRLHCRARQPQYYRAGRRADRSDETDRKKNAATPGPARSENEMGSAAMADPGHGPARQHEHRSLRRFFLRSLHARLPQASAGMNSLKKLME